MEAKLTRKEIQRFYDQEWVELIDYDWDEAEPYPKAGVVRSHAKTRKQLSAQVQSNAVMDSAILFVGDWNLPENSVLNFNKHRLVINSKQ
jgi:hypothetical protein